MSIGRTYSNQCFCPRVNMGYTANAGDAASNGFDLALQALVTKDLTVGLGVGYTHATFTKSVTVGGVPIVQKGDVVGLVTNVAHALGGDLVGNYNVPLTAEITGYLWAEDAYHRPESRSRSVTQIPHGVSYAPINVANPATNCTESAFRPQMGQIRRFAVRQTTY